MADNKVPHMHQLNLTDDQLSYLYACMKFNQFSKVMDLASVMTASLLADRAAVCMGETAFVKFNEVMDEHFKHADCGNPECELHGKGMLS